MFDASGIGVYLRECLPYLLEYPHTFFLFGDGERLAKVAAGRRNVVIFEYTVKPFSPAEIAGFPPGVVKKINRGDIFYSPFFNIPPGITIPVFVTIHDIVFADMPELGSKAGIALRMLFYRRAARLSRTIFTVSEFSKSRIQYRLGISKPVIVTHSAVQAYLLKLSTNARPNLTGQEIKIPKNDSILFTGNIKKHKGLLCLLDAFFAARKEGLRHKLVLVGNKDNFRSQDTEILNRLRHIKPEEVEFTGLISDEQLWRLLSGSSLLVQPSLYEGFGLPPLEAMIAGTKALISDIPVFKEIYKDYPVCFFKSGDVVDLKEKLLMLLHKREPEYIVLSQGLIEKYNFKKTASIIMENLVQG
jgi:glycosyltransferase involved in cell wall biosynthesis